MSRQGHVPTRSGEAGTAEGGPAAIAGVMREADPDPTTLSSPRRARADHCREES
jgi:hypothetical protein